MLKVGPGGGGYHIYTYNIYIYYIHILNFEDPPPFNILLGALPPLKGLGGCKFSPTRISSAALEAV